MVTVETIPIPSDTASDRDPISLEINHLDVWPQQQFYLYMDWNSALQKWMFDFQHSDLGSLFGKHPAQINQPHAFKKIIQGIFIDLTGRGEPVTPRSLGDNVVFAVIAGEDSPGSNPDQ